MIVALASAHPYDTTDADLPLLTEAFARRGLEAAIRRWDDPNADWDRAAATVVRSCWNYVDHRDSFLTWAARIPTLYNTIDTLRWNTDKVYLRDLAHAGVAVVPTQWDVAAVADLTPAPEWVVKPSVSAGSADTARWSAPEDVITHSRALQTAGRTAMVQPYIASVDEHGETAMIYLGGRFSHAIVKGPRLTRETAADAELSTADDISATTPLPAHYEAAERVLAACRERGIDPLYARIDLVEDASGRQLLLELELTEPSLFLPHADGAADRFVEALLRRLPG